MTSLASLLDLPDDVSVPMRIVRPHLVRSHESGTRRWCRAGEARTIMGITQSASTLRAWARRWWHLQEEGRMPEIRVMRGNDAAGSHWLYDWEDCWEYRRLHGGGPREAAAVINADQYRSGEAGSDDPEEAVIDHWVDRVTSKI